MLRQIILSFDPLSIGHMGETCNQHPYHHQILNNRFYLVVYHHRVVPWCFQCWILRSPRNFCTLLLNGLLGVCLCVLVSGMCSMNYHVLVRIVQTGFQPHTAATPFLDSRCPRAFFNPENEVCTPTTRGDIIHRLL